MIKQAPTGSQTPGGEAVTDKGDPEWDALVAKTIGELKQDGTLAKISPAPKSPSCERRSGRTAPAARCQTGPPSAA
jgi:hypothetical protein